MQTKYTKKSDKRNIIFIKIIILLSLILSIKLIYLQVFKHSYYVSELKKISIKIVEGRTAPRGRIYDRNRNLLVDNEPVKVIYYKKNNISTQEEISLAYVLAEKLEIDYSNIKEVNLKKFWIKKNIEESKKLITEDEYKKLEERRITSTDIENLKIERISSDIINGFNQLDKEAAYIYYLMNKGYSYEEKIIKNVDVKEEEYAYVASNIDNLNGVNIKLDWKRVYPFNETFKSILGSISKDTIPIDLKDYYLKEGYTLNDKVGISYLEYQYDKYLRGTKNIYEITSKGTKLIEEGTRGSDIVLTIDINLQKGVEQIISEELLKAKNEPNTEYYNKAFVIITKPNTGEILAMSGKQIVYKNDEYKIYDYTPGIITSSVTAGSIVKGASQITGYKYNALNIGEVRSDTCVKIASTPLKCSWKSLGVLNDITALKYSSNTYQFYTAMKVAGFNYVYNMGFSVSEESFKKYRDTFAQFGLGVKTEIDLPNEKLGYLGKSTNGGLLLDLSIGQYDTYTPIELAQYMTTFASGGNRYKLHLLDSVYTNDDLVYVEKPTILNTVDIDKVYLNRVIEGFKSVMEYGGTGSGYINHKYNPAGKTGTSQSFIDTDNDGKIDTETISATFAGFAPYDNPQAVFTVISPDVSNYKSNYQSYANRRIASRVSELYFSLYPQ